MSVHSSGRLVTSKLLHPSLMWGVKKLNMQVISHCRKWPEKVLDVDTDEIDENRRAKIFLNLDVTGDNNQKWKIVRDDKIIVNFYENDLRLDAFLEGTTDDTKVGCDFAVSGSEGQEWTTGKHNNLFCTLSEKNVEKKWNLHIYCSFGIFHCPSSAHA